jgi:hypothetical protein
VAQWGLGAAGRTGPPTGTKPGRCASVPRATGRLQPGGRCRVGGPGAPPKAWVAGGADLPVLRSPLPPPLSSNGAAAPACPNSALGALGLACGLQPVPRAAPPGWTLVNPANELSVGPTAMNWRRPGAAGACRPGRSAPPARARTPWPARSWRRNLRARFLRRSPTLAFAGRRVCAPRQGTRGLHWPCKGGRGRGHAGLGGLQVDKRPERVA